MSASLPVCPLFTVVLAKLLEELLAPGFPKVAAKEFKPEVDKLAAESHLRRTLTLVDALLLNKPLEESPPLVPVPLLTRLMLDAPLEDLGERSEVLPNNLAERSLN